MSESRKDGPTDWSRRDVLAGAATAGMGAAAIEMLTGCATRPAMSKAQEPGSYKANREQPPTAGAVPVTLKINGKEHNLALEPRVTLLDALRENVHLTGTKKGCDHGQCGACTVLMDGQRVDSCLILAVMAQGRQITTIEGLAQGDQLHPVQAAFLEHDAYQCGYCTPGQICSAVALIQEGRCKTEDEIREGMAGNICRCGAYPNIVAAVKAVVG